MIHRPASFSGNGARDLQKKWNARWAGKIAGNTTPKGYIEIVINYVKYQAHHLAWFYMTGEWPKEGIDHRNGRGIDNRWCNLRQGSQAQNVQNVAKRRNSTSRFLGVSWSKQNKKWHAQINADRKHYSLGHFESEEDAYSAYLAAKARLHPFQPVPRGVEA